MGLLDAFRGDEGVELQVHGMACEHCRNAVESVIESLEPVRSVSVRLEEGYARVRCRGPVEAGRIVEAVREAGYEARIADPGRG